MTEESRDREERWNAKQVIVMTFDSELTERFIQISPRVMENSTSPALLHFCSWNRHHHHHYFFFSSLGFCFLVFFLAQQQLSFSVAFFFLFLLFWRSNLMKNILLPNWSHKSVFQAIAKWCHNKKHLLHLTNAQWNQNNIFHHSLLTLITILLWKFLRHENFISLPLFSLTRTILIM